MEELLCVDGAWVIVNLWFHWIGRGYLIGFSDQTTPNNNVINGRSYIPLPPRITCSLTGLSLVRK